MNLCVFLGLLVYCVVANAQTCDDARDTFYNTNRECLLAFENAGAHVLVGPSGDRRLNDTEIELLCANASCQDAYTQYVEACSATNISVSINVCSVITEVASCLCSLGRVFFVMLNMSPQLSELVYPPSIHRIYSRTRDCVPLGSGSKGTIRVNTFSL